MLKLPLRYEGTHLLAGDGTEVPPADILAILSVFDALALAAELLDQHCPRPARPNIAREDIERGLELLRALPKTYAGLAHYG